MRISWRTIALFLVVGIWPQAGCHHVPGDKSVQDLRPIQQTSDSAKKQNLSAADITQITWLKNVEALEKQHRVAEAIALCEQMRGPGSPYALQATKKIAFLSHQTGD